MGPSLIVSGVLGVEDLSVSWLSNLFLLNAQTTPQKTPINNPIRSPQIRMPHNNTANSVSEYRMPEKFYKSLQKLKY